jgi:cytidylate kinase
VTDPMRISIDGPSGSGKTTLGIGLATHLDATFLDTGLTFRALALLLTESVLPSDDSWNRTICHIPFSANGPEKVLLHDHDITDDLWAAAVDDRLDHVSRDPARRAQIRAYHHRILSQVPRIVVAGRDVAVALLTTATLHVFLNADFAVRLERKRLQHSPNPGRAITVGVITERDLQALEECRRRQNSIVLDTTHASAHDILNQVIDKTRDIVLSQP